MGIISDGTCSTIDPYFMFLIFLFKLTYLISIISAKSWLLIVGKSVFVQPLKGPINLATYFGILDKLY